ncbi:MAG: RNA polymerase sigma factor [Bacteroidia bacterium]|nr:RNA polymerase sigma factor [Bacteroidia bacterium]
MSKDQFISYLESNQESLRRFLIVLCHGDKMTADDIAQDAMLKAWMKISSFDEKSKFSTWIFKIAYNTYLDFQKSSWRKNNESLDENIDNENFISEYSADETFLNDKLYVAIDKLPIGERSAVLLYYLEEKPIKEISKILEMPQSTIMSHLFRARKHLKSLLKNNRL